MDLMHLTSLIPSEITFLSMLKFIGILLVAAFAVSLIFRILFGKGSALNRAVSAAMGILCVYIMTVVIYTFRFAGLEQYLVPLPFVKFSGDYLYILPFTASDFSVICSEVLSMLILALLYNFADSVLPYGKRALTWFSLRFITVSLAIAIHYVLSVLTESFLPDLIVSYAPTILLICLVASLLAGILGVLLGLVLTVVNPIFGLIYGFFFSNKLGKQISKAMLTTAVLTALVAALGYFEYNIICISASALLSYVPLLAALLLLWYLIACKL